MTATDLTDNSPDDGGDLPPIIVSSQELVEAAGITFRQLDYWTRTGRLHCLDDRPPRSGIPRFYREEEIAVARALRVLIGFPDHETILKRVRDGYRGLVEPQPGVIVDLGVLCDESLELSA